MSFCDMRSFGICNLSVVPLRAEPSDKSELATQLLFGDHFEILERNEKWMLVRVAYDGYEGWIDPKQVEQIDEDSFFKLETAGFICGLKVSQTLITPAGDTISLLPGSVLPLFDGKFVYINEKAYEFADVATRPDSSTFKKDIAEAASFYLFCPYLWGGKTPFGIDCSGFTQMVFKQFGLKIKRDTWQQAEQGTMVNFLDEANPGDLAFFDNTEGRIIHVGIMLDKHRIIHASGRVRVDRIDNYGIYNEELGRHSHKLRVIKRFSKG